MTVVLPIPCWASVKCYMFAGTSRVTLASRDGSVGGFSP